MSIYLSRQDVRRLTGRVQRGAQIQRLAVMGYAYELDGDGWPLVLTATVLDRHRKESTPRRGGPNFGFLVRG
jgi:hypothetical protein